VDPNQHHNALNKDDMLLWYEIKSILGQGGFGITYLAKDTNLDQMVAIKEYLPTEFSTRDASSTVQPISEKHTEIFDWGKQRFMDEAKTLAQFKHSNIVRVQSFFESNNTGYMVMEYEEGTDFSVLIKAGEDFDEARLLKIVIPILDGLEIVHKNGFIHRDIKPQNIFIRKDGSPVLIDFGSARQAIGGQTRTLTSLVTPGYAPFEQYHEAEGKQGPWTDIYSLGATLYCAITGKAPVESLKRGMARLEHNTDAYLNLTDLRAEKYSEHFLKAIDHALQFSEKDRPASVSEWKKMLLGEIAAPDAETQLRSPAVNTEATEGTFAQTEAVEQSIERLPDTLVDASTVDATAVDLPLTQEKEMGAGDKGKKNPGLTIGIFIGAIISITIVVAVLVVDPDQSVDFVRKLENAESNQNTIGQLNADLDSKSAELDKLELERKVEAEKREAEKNRQAEAVRLQKQLEQEKIESEKKRLAAEKSKQEALALQAALLKKQKEDKKKAELARQAALKKKKEKEKILAQQARLKKEREQKKLAQQEAEKQALINSQKQTNAPSNYSFSGRYISVLNTKGYSGYNLKSLFGGKPEFDTKIRESNSKITGTFTGQWVKGEIEGVREDNIIKFDWYMTGGSFGSASGTGQWEIKDHREIIKGKWSARHESISGEWNLTRQPDN